MFGKHFVCIAKGCAVAALFMYYPIAVCCSNIEEGSKTTMMLVEKNNGQTVNIRLGETTQITLPENATTGYRWGIDQYDEEFITILDTEPHYTANAVGSGGAVTFIVQGKKIGLGEVLLKNWRIWEGDSSVSERFHIKLNVVAS
ncbi:MAG: protease inhibitor I42 family protein [Chlorobiaceae bacterium]